MANLGLVLDEFTEKQKEFLGLLAATLDDLGTIEDVLTYVHKGAVGAKVNSTVLLTEVLLRNQAQQFQAGLEEALGN